MSEENVEIVRGVYEAEIRREGPSVLDLYVPNVELEVRSALGNLVGGGIYRGRDGVKRFFRRYYEAWDQVEYEIDELIGSGDDVISVVTNRGRGRESGIALEWVISGVWTLRDSRIVRVVFFSTRADALEAAGLTE